ncbi:MAG TPA: hypothetical protein VNF45_04445 [Candidatus Binataceae bacterium]|nr:hypothetical protein [Candidatus Binataceae bacterium]
MSVRGTRLPYRAGFVAAAILALALSGCAEAIVSHGQVNRDQADKIKIGLQQLRGLEFKYPVPLVVMSQQDAGQVLEAEMNQRQSDAQLAIEARVGEMIGLYPEGIDLKAATMSMLQSEIIGFYDAPNQRMIVVQDRTRLGLLSAIGGLLRHRDVRGEMLLAHELTHALQDQHFEIHAALERIKDNDDRDLALKSVAEGDATLAGFSYIKGGTNEASVQDLLGRLDALPHAFAEQSPNVPAGLLDPMEFQYDEGTRFVVEAWRRGGWAGVNALYGKPPLSTQQVADPSLYFDRFTPPARINIAGYEAAMAGWRPAFENTYGALTMRIILREHPDGAAQVALARAWAGDRMVVLERGDQLALLWIVVMADGESAAEFTRAYGVVLDRIARSSAGGKDTQAHRVAVRGTAVLIAIGGAAAKFDELAPAVWRASTIDSGGERNQASSDSRALAINSRSPR